MKKKTMVRYVITGATDLSANEIMEDFDPLMIEKVNLLMSNLLGCDCCIQIDDIELVEVEECEE